MRKPNGSQKAKARWKMKAARNSGDDFHDPESKDNILGRNKDATGTLGRAPQRPNFGTVQSLEVD